MAEILGVQTVGGIWAMEVDSDPSLLLGTAAPTGSYASINNGSGFFLKTGILDTDWLDLTAPLNAISGDVELDFDFPNGDEDGNASITILNPLVTNANIDSFSYVRKTNVDHDDLDDFVAENITFNIQNIVNGVSFDIVATAPNNTWGKYLITYKILI